MIEQGVEAVQGANQFSHTINLIHKSPTLGAQLQDILNIIKNSLPIFEESNKKCKNKRVYLHKNSKS